MEQPTFSDLEYEGKKRKTCRELFLERMDGLIPWQKLEGRINPLYPKAGRGRHPYPLPVMLRVHCVQLFYNPAFAGAGSQRSRHGGFALRVRPGAEVRGAEAHRPPARRDHHPQFPPPVGAAPSGAGLLEEINAHLESQGLKLREGTIVDAPSSRCRRPPRTGTRSGTRRCIRPRRGTSGTSG